LVLFGTMLRYGYKELYPYIQGYTSGRKKTVKHKTLFCIFNIPLYRDIVKSDQKTLINLKS